VAAIQHFLLVFDHELGSLISEESFGSNSEAALVAYAECERKYRGNDLVEIVLIGSDSIETVRLTHANYFDGTAAVSKYLIGL
jgi:hypothetical protein